MTTKKTSAPTSKLYGAAATLLNATIGLVFYCTGSEQVQEAVIMTFAGTIFAAVWTIGAALFAWRQRMMTGLLVLVTSGTVGGAGAAGNGGCAPLMVDGDRDYQAESRCFAAAASWGAEAAAAIAAREPVARTTMRLALQLGEVYRLCTDPEGDGPTLTVRPELEAPDASTDTDTDDAPAPPPPP